MTVQKKYEWEVEVSSCLILSGLPQLVLGWLHILVCAFHMKVHAHCIVFSFILLGFYHVFGVFLCLYQYLIAVHDTYIHLREQGHVLNIPWFFFFPFPFSLFSLPLFYSLLFSLNVFEISPSFFPNRCMGIYIYISHIYIYFIASLWIDI